MESFPPKQDSKDFDHLQWLNLKDQQVLCRAECVAAVQEESRLTADIQAAIYAHSRAIEHCRAASETDPDWFTLDVQDSHSRRISVLRDALAALAAEAPPVPENAVILDAFRGKLFSSWAKTAHATSKVAAGLQESEGVQRFAEQSQAAAASAASALSALPAKLTSLAAGRASVGGEGGAVPPSPSLGEATGRPARIYTVPAHGFPEAVEAPPAFSGSTFVPYSGAALAPGPGSFSAPAPSSSFSGVAQSDAVSSSSAAPSVATENSQWEPAADKTSALLVSEDRADGAL